MLIVCQRGHVPRTTGATGAPGEQAFATAAADRIRAHVERLGHQVRIIDADPPATAYRGDAFVALHYDSSTNPGVRGASVGYRTPEGGDFAQRWKRHYAAQGWSGGFRDDNYTTNLAGYYGVRRAVEQHNRRAFISEAGFGSNPGDAALLASPEGPDRVARAVAAALAELFGQPIPQEEDDMPLTDTDLANIANAVWARDVGSFATAADSAADVVRQLRGSLAHLVARTPGDVDEAELARQILTVLTPASIAEALPENLAVELADELAARLARPRQ